MTMVNNSTSTSEHVALVCLAIKKKKKITVLKLVDKLRSIIRNINDTIQASHK